LLAHSAQGGSLEGIAVSEKLVRRDLCAVDYWLENTRRHVRH